MVTAKDIKEGNTLWVTLELDRLVYTLDSVSASIKGMRSRMFEEFICTPEEAEKMRIERCKSLNIPIYRGWSSSIPLTKEKAVECLRQYRQNLNDCLLWLTGIIAKFQSLDTL